MAQVRFLVYGRSTVLRLAVCLKKTMKRVVISQYDKVLLLKSRVSKSRLGLEKLTESRSRSRKFFQVLVSGLGLEFFPSLGLGLGLDHQGLDYITNQHHNKID